MPNPMLFVPLCLRVSLPLFGSYTLNGQECYFLRQERGTILPVYSIASPPLNQNLERAPKVLRVGQRLKLPDC